MELSYLPNEVLQHIFGFLDHQSRLTVLEVCRQWNELASTAKFMDRIWFRITIWETKFLDQVAAFECSSRKYRHVIIDFEAGEIRPISKPAHRLRRLIKISGMLTVVNNIETLVLFTMQEMTASDLLILLPHVPNLRRLCLLGQKVPYLHELSFTNFPNVETRWPVADHILWTEIFSEQSRLVLQNITDVTLTVPLALKIKVDIFQQMFPNINQLQVTVNDPSIVNLIDACKSQLEKLSICSISSNLLILFCEIRFPKLSHFSLNTDIILDPMAMTKCEQFFKHLDHTRNLRHLKLSLPNTSIIRTICSNCTSLRVLEIFTININFLENISNLKDLQKLSIRKLDDDRCTPAVNRYYHYAILQHMNQPRARVCDFYEPIESLKSLEINGSFESANELLKFLHTTGPNLETLVLRDIAEPEEALRILSGSSPNIRHLKMSFKRQQGEPPELDFGYLMNKTNLVTYSLDNVPINTDSIPKWIQMAPNLSTIELTNCEIFSDEHLTILGSYCPTLSRLELKGCEGLTIQRLKDIKQNLPHVSIFYDRVFRPIWVACGSASFTRIRVPVRSDRNIFL